MTHLFANISPRNQEKLLRLLEATALNVKKNCKVLSSVKSDNYIGVVVSGYMQIIKTDFNGNRSIIEELEENDVFGTNLSSLNNQEYDLITKEDSKIIIIDYNNIILINENTSSYYNQFIKNMFEIINDKIKDKNNRINILTKKTIRNKLLEYFKIMANKNHSKIIYITMNYSELADFLAIDRSAMSREIKYLIEEGFIKKDYKKITLLY